MSQPQKNTHTYPPPSDHLARLIASSGVPFGIRAAPPSIQPAQRPIPLLPDAHTTYSFPSASGAPSQYPSSSGFHPSPANLQNVGSSANPFYVPLGYSEAELIEYYQSPRSYGPNGSIKHLPNRFGLPISETIGIPGTGARTFHNLGPLPPAVSTSYGSSGLSYPAAAVPPRPPTQSITIAANAPFHSEAVIYATRCCFTAATIFAVRKEDQRIEIYSHDRHAADKWSLTDCRNCLIDVQHATRKKGFTNDFVRGQLPKDNAVLPNRPIVNLILPPTAPFSEDQVVCITVDRSVCENYYLVIRPDEKLSIYCHNNGTATWSSRVPQKNFDEMMESAKRRGVKFSMIETEKTSETRNYVQVNEKNQAVPPPTVDAQNMKKFCEAHRTLTEVEAAAASGAQNQGQTSPAPVTVPAQIPQVPVKGPPTQAPTPFPAPGYTQAPIQPPSSQYQAKVYAPGIIQKAMHPIRSPVVCSPMKCISPINDEDRKKNPYEIEAAYEKEFEETRRRLQESNNMCAELRSIREKNRKMEVEQMVRDQVDQVKREGDCDSLQEILLGLSLTDRIGSAEVVVKEEAEQEVGEKKKKGSDDC